MSHLDFDMLSPEGLENPWEFLGRIQEEDPIFWSDIQQAWLITKLDDVRAAFLDKRLSSQRLDFYLRQFEGDLKTACPLFMRHAPLIVGFIDAPDHSRIRALVVRAFSKPVVDRMRAAGIRIIEDMLALCERERDIDFASRLSYELPTLLIMAIFDFPLEHRQKFDQLAEDIRNTLGSSRPTFAAMLALEKSMAVVFDILSGLIEEATANPSDNLLSQLVQAHNDGDRLSRDELLTLCLAIVAGGVDTTAAAISLFTRWIAADPALLEEVRRSPEAASKLVDELLRYPGQSKSNTRVASESFEWRGKQIRKGDFVFLMQNAANTDAEAWDRPLEIDVGRSTRNAVPFGHGAHHCIGAMLAKMELTELLHRFFTRFDVEVQEDKAVLQQSYIFIGYKNLPIRVTPRHV